MIKKLSKHSIRAVIFDMDGLLVDSEPLHFLADQMVFAKYGKSFSKKEQIEFTGRTVLEQTHTLRLRWHIVTPLSSLLKQRKIVFKNLVMTKLKLSKGAEKLINYLIRQKVPLGLGTSAETWYVNLVLKRFKLKSTFQSIVTSNQIKRGKPFPDTYLKVARQLDILSKYCLVLEDSISGIIAANRAGMCCFAIPGKFTSDHDYSNADKKFTSLTEVKNFIENHELLTLS